MRARTSLIVFGPSAQRYALRVESVERVVRAVQLTPLPDAPRAIRGIFSLHGRIIPVGDLQRRFGAEEQPISLNDHMVVARSPRRQLAVLAQGQLAVTPCAEEDIVRAEAVLYEAQVIAGIARLPAGLLLIVDLARFLCLADEPVLDRALHDFAPAH